MKETYLFLNPPGREQSVNDSWAGGHAFSENRTLFYLPGNLIGPSGNTNGANNKTFYRYGATGSFNWQTLNLQLMYMKGVDDKSFNTLDPAKD